MTHIPGYIQSLIFAVVFLLFISAEIGWLLLYVLAIDIVLSAVLGIISRKNYSVSVTGFSGVMHTGESLTAEITLEKKGFCFLPYIRIIGSFSGVSFTANSALLLKRTATVQVKLRAESCGLNRMIIQEVRGGDFLGVTSFRLKDIDGAQTSVAVLPRIIQYSGPDIRPSMLPDEREDAEEGMTVLFGGTPGYEHREYADGDSPRKINYKLSAKRRRLMVRMDENTGTQRVKILLSNDANSDCAEQALALTRHIVSNGGSAELCYRGERCGVSTPETLERLREWLAFRDFTAPGMFEDLNRWLASRGIVDEPDMPADDYAADMVIMPESSRTAAQPADHPA